MIEQFQGVELVDWATRYAIPELYPQVEQAEQLNDDRAGRMLDTIYDQRTLIWGDLVAFCCFGLDAQVPGGDYSAVALDIGLGVRPDLTGQGRGLTYVNAVIDFARRRFVPTAFRVTIAEFNKRALRVWEKAGFWPVQTFQRGKDGRAFVVLMREV